MKKIMLMITFMLVAMSMYAITEVDVTKLMKGPVGTTITDTIYHKTSNYIMVAFTYTVYTRLARGVLVQYMSNQSSGTACSMLFVPLSDFGSYVKGN